MIRETFSNLNQDTSTPQRRKTLNLGLPASTSDMISGDRAAGVIDNLGFQNPFKEYALGFSRDIWVPWNNNLDV